MTDSEGTKSSSGGFRLFKDDLAKALTTWQQAPLLPLFTVVLAMVALLPQLVSEDRGIQTLTSLVTIPVGAFSIGWVGTERIWYLRLFRGRNIEREELWRFTWSFFGRFFVLSLLMGLIASPFLIYYAVRLLPLVREDPSRFSSGQSMSPEVLDRLTGPLLLFLAVFLLIDIALTFVTPALAFSTQRVSEALKLGFRTIVDEWPKSAWYTLFPPLVLVLVSRFLPITTLGFGPHTMLLISSTLLNLWFKGANASFYLQTHEVGDNGTAA